MHSLKLQEDSNYTKNLMETCLIYVCLRQVARVEISTRVINKFSVEFVFYDECGGLLRVEMLRDRFLVIGSAQIIGIIHSFDF